MTALIATVFVASLVGSLHCVGMCGAFVAFAVGSTPDTPRRWRLAVAYHGGRLMTYVLLGALGGALGSALDWGGAMLGVSRIAAMGAGALMIGFGVITLLRLKGVRVRLLTAPAWIQRLVGAGQRAAMTLPPVPRAGTIGLLTTLLPCGWLWAFAITAAGTASPLWGGLTMAAFWAGTVPALAALGLGLEKLTGTLAPRLPALTATALIVVGLWTVWGRVIVSPTAMARIPPAVTHSPHGSLETTPPGQTPCPACDRAKP